MKIKKILFIAILSIFILGILMNGVSAKTYSQTVKITKYNKNQIHSLDTGGSVCTYLSTKKDSMCGKSLALGLNKHKFRFTKIIAYVGKKPYTKTIKSVYDYTEPCLKYRKYNKVKIYYKKMSSKEYKLSKKYCR